MTELVVDPQDAGVVPPEGTPTSDASGGSSPAGRLSPAVSSRERWLRERRHGIGASEVAAILGEDPRRGPLSVYADKVAGKLDESEVSWLAFGRDVEGAIAKGYAHKTGRPVYDLGAFDIVRHPDLPILGATRDRETEGSKKFPAPTGGRGPLELKAVGFHRRGDWHDEPPLHFVIQVQMQMACTGAAWGSLGALFGGIQIADPVDLPRNDGFIKVALEAVAEFWWRVENRRPPEADTKPDTHDAIKRLWPADNGEAIALTREDLALVEQLEVVKLRREDFDRQRELLEARIAIRMGDHAVGRLPDYSAITRKTTHVDARLCACGAEIAGAYSFRRLHRWFPKHLRKARRALERAREQGI